MLAPGEVRRCFGCIGWVGARSGSPLSWCGRYTVKRYIAAGGWAAYRKPQRQRQLDGLKEWLAERFRSPTTWPAERGGSHRRQRTVGSQIRQAFGGNPVANGREAADQQPTPGAQKIQIY